MIKKFIVLTIALLMLFSFTSCRRKKNKVYEDGYFQYIIVDKNSLNHENLMGVAIVGFTESGKEQEIIDFPREIDGKPVTRIGFRDESFYHNNSFHVYSEKLRKIYVHDNIKEIVYFEGSEVNMIVCSISFDIYFDFDVFLKGIYINKSLFDEENCSYEVFPANIAFLHNFSTQNNNDYYRIDNIELGEKIPTPPIPKRSGYEFIGWYMEPECINVWDFDNEPTIPTNTEFRLHANWRAI